MFNEESSSGRCLNIISKKCFSYVKPDLHIGVLSILLGISAIVQAQRSKLVLSVEDIKVLIPQIEAAERIHFSNLKIDSETWVETKSDLSDPCQPWQRTPIYVSSTAWFDGNPKGKARVDVHKQIAKWIDGPASYGESSYSVSFDGQYGRVVDRTRGHSGKTFFLKEGKLLPDAPVGLRTNDAYTGAKFSLYFFFNNDLGVSSFSQFLRKATSPDVVKLNAFEFTLEEFQGVECIKIDSTFDRHIARITYWLDPARGFALLGHDNISIREDGGERFSKRMRVTELKKVSDDIWWPMEAYVESDRREPGEPYTRTRTVYHASNVVANDPNFDEKIFTIPFPDGYLIDDQVTGRTYRVGEN